MGSKASSSLRRPAVYRVKAGDTLSIGKRTLQFIPTPMLHWPDSMVTYCPEETILFSNDAFGQHLASGCRYDDDNDLPPYSSKPRNIMPTSSCSTAVKPRPPSRPA